MQPDANHLPFAAYPARSTKVAIAAGAAKSLNPWDFLILAVIGALTFLRLAAVEKLTFSYDYAAYMFYFQEISDLSWHEAFSTISLSFPYVLLQGFSLIEWGFFAIAKVVLLVFDPADAFAFFAAVSVTVRCAVMRSFRVGWLTMLLVQVVALTLLEANAIRAGMALTLCMVGLRLALARRRWMALLLFVAACSVHLQTLVFVLPFLGFLLLSRFFRGRSGHRLAVMLAIALGGGAVWAVFQLPSFTKLQDYQGIQSTATGVNLLALLTIAYVTAVAFAFFTIRGRMQASDATEYFWFCVFLACLPSVVMYLLGTDLGSVGARAWQFAVVILASIPVAKWLKARARAGLRSLLVLLFLAAGINVLIRYPLSNFFAPPFEEQLFTPSWGA